nr:hypothetical protein [Streptomyces sp. DSM 41633]
MSSTGSTGSTRSVRSARATSTSAPVASAAARSALTPYGWDDAWEAAFVPYAERGLLPGRVLRVDRGRCDVVTPVGVVHADTEFVVPRDPM